MRWRILAKIKKKGSEARRETILRFLLKNRRLTSPEKIREFLHPKKISSLTAKELGLSPIQINKAVKRLRQAIRKKEKIIIYGDYDTDGVCSTAVIWEALHRLGGNVMPFIPLREEGYGLKVERLDQFKDDQVSLIVTVDQGIVQGKQIAHAKRIGLDVIVTDHHIPGKKMPSALAILHTTKLSGCGVSWFLARALAGDLKKEAGLDLVTIATLSDIIPLVGASRSLVKFGLKAVRRTKRPGLLSLYKLAGIEKGKIGTYEIGFIIAPRLNAAGRMDDPMESLRLICTSNRERAASLARKLDEKNRERQKLTEQMIIEARDLWLAEDGKSPIIFVKSKSFDFGVAGLVASRLKDEFYRPAIILAPRKDHWVASARSISELNLVETIRSFADILESHGGHARAAGFSIKEEKIEILRKNLLETVKKKVGALALRPTLKIEAEIVLEDINLEFFEKIVDLGPFGEGNPYPVFCIRGAKVIDALRMGRESQHLKLIINSSSERTYEVVGFNMAGVYSHLSPDSLVDIAFSLILNEWRGEKRLQLKAEDIKIRTS